LTVRRRLLVIGGVLLTTWAPIAYVTGGFTVHPMGIRFSARGAWRPAMLALAAFGVHAVVYGRRELDEDIDWLIGATRALLVPTVAAAAVASFVFATVYGTFVAGGADPYGYVSQADLWLRGSLRVEQPFVATIPWPFADWTFTPIGYRPALTGHAFVPIYAPGLPLLMALFTLIAGSQGPYYVVPVSCALSVWVCYRLGTRMASPLVGAVAAILLAASPVFLYQSLWPMSDIPVTLFWMLALLLAADATPRLAIAAGLCAAVAAAIRPNLAPAAAIPLVYLWWTGRPWRPYAVALVPGVLLIAIVNKMLYGAVVSAGYGALETLYSRANLMANVTRYGSWLVMTQTPLVAAALLSLVRRPPPNAYTRMVSVFACTVVVAYLFYAPFDVWWYLRFLIPALPIVLILMCDGSVWMLGFLPRAAQIAVFVTGLTLLLNHYLVFISGQHVTTFRQGEHRYMEAAQYIAASTPPNAVVFAMQHSGSVRYYANRLTLRYDWLDPPWLDRAIDTLRAQGYRPYILLEEWEESDFTQRFGAANVAGRLSWPPIARFGQSIHVRLYEMPAPPPPAR